KGQVLKEQWTLYPKGKPVTVLVTRVGLVLPSGDLASLHEARLSATDVDVSSLRGVEAMRHTSLRIAMHRLDGVAVMRNPAALRTFGKLDPDIQRDDFAALFQSPEEAIKARTLALDGQVYSEQVELCCLEGPTWHGIDVRRGLDPATGDPVLLINARDISDRIRVEEALKQALDAEKNFLASMSHEIRTPLNSVLGFIELVRGTPLTDQQKAFLDNADISARHLLSLIDDVLDVSKIEAGQLNLGKEEVDLEEVLLESLVIVSTRVKKGVELGFDLPELPSLVFGDRVRIKQIFVNLLGNATKFTEHGSIRLKLSPQVGQGGHVTISVEDTGIGIRPEMVPKLFAPFRQAHSSHFGGSGLGLFLSRSLARMMGGDIDVESRLGQGTTFHVHLALRPATRKELRFSFHGKRVLLLLTEADLEKSFRRGFTDAGAQVVAPANMDRAVRVIEHCLGKTGAVDLVILDWTRFSPTASSLAVLLRDLYPHVKILALVPGEVRDNAFDRTLPKPITFYRLARAVNELLQKDESPGDERSTAPTAPMRVLLAEDVEMNILLARAMLRSFPSVVCDVVRNGLQAVEAVQGQAYDLVFMDVQMPELDGIEATTRIRALGIRVPIVAMSASALSDDIQRGYAAGMDGYLTKPIRRIEIGKVLARYRPRAATLLSAAVDPLKPERVLRTQALTHFSSVAGPERAVALVMALVASTRTVLPQLQGTLAAGDSTGFERALQTAKVIVGHAGLHTLENAAAELLDGLREGTALGTLAIRAEAFCGELREIVDET
ncbi:MAG: ATP-binding protein, partial [Myxococcales bacterium]